MVKILMRLTMGNNAMNAAKIPLSLLPKYVTSVRMEPPIIKYNRNFILSPNQTPSF
jgi:hypothetical protein